MAEFNDGTQNIVSTFTATSSDTSEVTLNDNTFHQVIEEVQLETISGIVGGTAEGNVKKIYWRD